MADYLYGGKEDLTSALGFEEDGITTIILRKKLEGKALKFIEIIRWVGQTPSSILMTFCTPIATCS